MSKTRHTLFLFMISLLKYSIILFHLIQLPNVKSISEIKIKIKVSENSDSWRGVLSDDFTAPSEVTINGTINNHVENLKYFYGVPGEYNIVIKFNQDISSYENMFRGLKRVDEITLVEFKTPKVKSMRNMFAYSPLKKIIFQNVDTSTVEDMSCLFTESKSLEQIDLSTLDTSSVKNMSSMFRYCEQLKVIDASSFDTSQVTDMYDIFGYCFNLVYINISSFNTKKAEVIQGTFISCEKLRYLDISNLDYTYIKTNALSCSTDPCRYHYFFANCGQLKCLNAPNFYIRIYYHRIFPHIHLNLHRIF